MKVFTHFAGVGVSNSYIIANENSSEAVIVDPGRFDVPLLKLVEDNGYYIRAILVSHDHDNHINGIKTIMKIYDAKIYSPLDEHFGYRAIKLKDQDSISICGMTIRILGISGHSGQSLCYKIEDCIFTGDVLSAGRIGTTQNNFSRAAMLNDVRDKICSLPGRTVIFPGHGPPSTIKAEREINSSLYEEL